MKHVQTVYYLGAPFGSTSISPARAAPYLSWASTQMENGNEMARAGIKTMSYTDANRTSVHDVLYKSPEAAFAHSCSGSRIHDIHDHVAQYLMNPGSSALRSAYAAYVRERSSGQSVNAVFQDDSVPPGYYGKGFFTPSLPCGYTLDSWLAAQRGLQASIDRDTIWSGVAITSAWPLFDNPSTIGGNYEGCYVAVAPHEQGGSVWLNIQKAHLYVVGRKKLFECMGLDTTPATDAFRGRMYQIASFLMVYNPTYSLLWETYATPSRVSVMPESQLVPTDPVVNISSITSLRTSTGAYAREYRKCYYAGRAIGACAMVVNPDGITHSFPRLALTYHHTLELHGYGVLDGGTVTFNGGAHSSTIPELSAVIAVP